MAKRIQRRRKARSIPSKLDLRGELEILAAEASGAGAGAEGTDGGGEPSLPKFRMVANSGRPMRVSGYYDPVIINLAGARFDKPSTPILMDHDVSKRIGHTTSQEVTDKRITAAGLVSSSSPDAQSFVADSKTGFPFQASVGADIVSGYYVDEGEKATVNGKEWKGPLVVAEKTLIREISVTVLGADANTSTKVAASVSGQPIQLSFAKERGMQFEAFVKSMGFDLDKLTEEQVAGLRAQWQRVQAGGDGTAGGGDDPPEPGDGDGDGDGAGAGDDPPVQAKRKKVAGSIAATREAAANEERRIDRIRSVAAQYRGVKKVRLDGKDVPLATVKAQAIREGWGPNKFELACLRSSRTQEPKTRGPGIHVQSTDVEAKALECATLRAIAPGLPESDKNPKTGRKYGFAEWYPDKVLEASHAKQYDGIGLHYLMDLNIRAAGQFYTGSRKSDEFLKTFLHAEREIRAAGDGFSTLAVSNILESAANKVLLAAWEAQEVVWDQICGIKSLSDFKTHNFYRLTVNGKYAKVGASGELKHGEFGDEKLTLSGDTYGMILGLTRKDMINDDLNAFEQIPSALGRLGALAIEAAVFAMILGNANSFFHSNNKNLIDPDLDIDGLSAAALAFRNRVDAFGRPIMVRPDRILVGAQDEVLAGELFKESAATWVDDDASSTGGTRKVPGNPHVGKYRPIVSPYLNNTDILQMDGTAFTGQDSNQWYMLCNPSTLAAFLIGFLNGKRTPVIESADSDFDHLGMKWRSYHDWGVGQGDTEGAVKSEGTA